MFGDGSWSSLNDGLGSVGNNSPWDLLGHSEWLLDLNGIIGGVSSDNVRSVTVAAWVPGVAVVRGG
jgi:hypothetical protein